MAWSSTNIPKLIDPTTDVRDYINKYSLPIIAIEYVGNTPTTSAIRCHNDLADGGDFEIWFTETLPSSFDEDTANAIKISYVGKTPAQLVNEINSISSSWKAYCVYESRLLYPGELWNYFLDFTYTSRETGWWSNYTGCTYTPDKTFNGKYIIRVNRIASLYDSQSIIEVKAPHKESIYSPWYLRVQPGTFIIKNDETTYLYKIKEFETFGGWSHISGRPFIYVNKSFPLSIVDNMIKVRHQDIRNIKVEINGVVNYSIKDVFPQQGIIIMKDKISFGTNVQVSYEYRESSLIYKSLNLNPNFNKEIKDKYIIIYILPYIMMENSSVVYNDTTIKYTYGSTLEEAYYSITDSSKAVILAILKLNKAVGYDIVDLRTPGGGAASENVLINQIESSMYNDITHYNGKPFPGNGSILVEVPFEYDIQDIRVYLDKYIASGVYPIIHKIQE